MPRPEAGVFRGRFQPPGHHHAAVIMHFAERYSFDTIHIIVPDVSETGRSPRNPFTGKEIAAMWTQAFQHDYDCACSIDPVVQHTPLDRSMLRTIETPAVFFTREKAWYRLFRLITPFTRLANRPIRAVYEARTSEPYRLVEEQGYTVLDSSTEIRQLMAADFSGKTPEKDWHDYVPPSAAALIDEEYEDARNALKPADEQTFLDRHRKFVDQGIGWTANLLR